METLLNNIRKRIGHRLETIDVSANLEDILQRNQSRISTKMYRDNPRNKPPRIAAVLIALCPADNNQIIIPLMVRTQYEGVHSGQVSFPGGGYEITDANLAETALREAKEEIGLIMPPNNIIGTLHDIYIAPSHSWVTPIVGFLDKQPTYLLDNNEVAHLLEAPLSDLQNPNFQGQRELKMPNGFAFHLPTYQLKGHEIWGATAKMLADVLEMI